MHTLNESDRTYVLNQPSIQFGADFVGYRNEPVPRRPMRGAAAKRVPPEAGYWSFVRKVLNIPPYAGEYNAPRRSKIPAGMVNIKWMDELELSERVVYATDGQNLNSR